MGSLADLAAVFGSDKLAAYRDPASGFRCRDAIKAIIAECLLQNSTGHWLTLLWQRGFWAAEVYDWKTLYASEGFRALEMTQCVHLPQGNNITLLRSPLRFNGVRPEIGRPAPRLGADTARISAQMQLKGACE
ncbi:hypothetical protein SODG_005553 [Sodalis praecaptivus]|uniref:CoA transferase n=1 Tax=Sodalis praecaptivus TaxID=1239307 RepID=UPI00280B6838|nr:CoA transferase [Sodalis praecaptivus]